MDSTTSTLEKVRALFLALSIPALVCGDYPEMRGYEAEHYDVTLRPNLSAGTVEGTVSIRLRTVAPALSAITLDASNMEVKGVTENGAALIFEWKDDLLAVTLPKPAEAMESHTLVVRYRAKPTRGMRFFPDHIYTVFSTSRWLVCNDRPDNRSTFRLELWVPEGFTVVASGRKKAETIANGLKKSVWEQKQPISTFVFGFAAGQFQRGQGRQGNTELQYLSGKHTPEQLQKIFQATGPAMAFFEQKSGVPYPSTTYSQVLIAGGVEQEVSSFTLLPHEYGADLLGAKGDLWLLAHELAHQWWGIGLTCRDWSDFWLNEGIASFLADAFLESYSGRPAYDAQIEKAFSRYQELAFDGKDRPLLYREWKEPGQAGGPLPYVKGAYFLHMLRQRMGDDSFWKGLRAYTQENFGKSVETKQFQKAMEQAHGKPLSDLFDHWAYSATRASK